MSQIIGSFQARRATSPEQAKCSGSFTISCWTLLLIPTEASIYFSAFIVPLCSLNSSTTSLSLLIWCAKASSCTDSTCFGSSLQVFKQAFNIMVADPNTPVSKNEKDLILAIEGMRNSFVMYHFLRISGFESYAYRKVRTMVSADSPFAI